MDQSATLAAGAAGAGAGMLIFELVLCVAILVAVWKIFAKAGRPGWYSLIPIFNAYTEFDIVYGNGLKMFLLLIPVFNIYVSIKFSIDLAHAYGKSTAFGIGLIFLSPIFMLILGFDGSQYQGTV